MEINWFPGHMAKSTREIENNLKCSDCVIYVLDCRAVRSCFNPNFDKMIHIPIVYVLNKSDIAPETAVSEWLNKLSVGNDQAVAVDGTSSSCRKKLLGAIKRACAPTIEKQKRRGILTHIRAMVIGVPNTGKTTIINSLCGKSRLKTGDRAGVTRTAQWARVDETLDILDTPGTLYPKIADRSVGENLAIIGSIKDEVIDIVELGTALIDKLNAIDENLLSERFGKRICGGIEGIGMIAEVRGYRSRGGEYDYERTASALVDDFRKGRLGKIALERV